MKKMKVFTVALALLVVAAAIQPADAACPTSRRITSTPTGAAYSYLYTPGVNLGDNGIGGSSVTENFGGTFWAVGQGDPALEAGADSGAFAALGWLYYYPGYPALINTGWNADGVDGCIDATPSTCTAIQLTDVNPTTGEPVFALLTAEQDPGQGLSYNYNQAGNAPINLAPLPLPALTNSVRNTGTGGVIVDVAAIDAAAFDAGLYLDANCTGGGGGIGLETFIPGVAWYTQEVPRGSQAPTDTSLETGGWVPTGVTTPFGQPVQLDLGCNGDTEIYLTYAFVNESGFPASSTSGAATRIQCNPNIADPEQRLRIKQPQPQTTKPGNRKR